MAEPAHILPPRSSAKARQREIRQCLAGLGLARGRYALWRGPLPEASEQEHGRRLREALQKLGPVFASFGRYLSARVDLLPERYRLGLASLAVAVRPMPIAGVREQIARELDGPPGDAFAGFDEKPLEIGLLFQTHRALLPGGQPVLVKVALADGAAPLTADLASLEVLQDAFAGEEWAGLSLEGAIADFRNTVQQQVDCVHEAKTLEAAAQDAEEYDLVCVPRVYGDLSSARLLTREHLSGWSLAEVLRSAGERDREPHAPTGPAPAFANLDLPDLAGRLSTAWLRQALLSRFFPVDTRAGNIMVLPDNRLAFDGAYASLPSASRKHLWDYLLAASTADPDQACTHLFGLMEKRGRSVHEDELRHRFRQAVPFRDSERRSGPENTRGLGEHVLVHWRLAQAHGCRPPLHLLRFYRSLFLVNEVAHQLDSSRDWLRDGLENVRVHAALAQVRELMSPGQWNQSLEKFAPIFLELPRRLDEVLTLVAEGSARMHLQVRETAEHRGHKNSTAVTAALLLALAGSALLAHHLAPAEALGGWGRKAGAAVFLLVGVLLLGRLSGTR